ncbi:UNVERIFIED_CONTAM: hypothetical protein Sradi_6839200 [Sesamum radiatum]|uniref:Uncharacterized protein n=1 Tax=Sesamum radiatum TaxID=300843 RepID=A0AAW2JMS7_SESRA
MKSGSVAEKVFEEESPPAPARGCRRSFQGVSGPGKGCPGRGEDLECGVV